MSSDPFRDIPPSRTSPSSTNPFRRNLNHLSTSQPILSTTQTENPFESPHDAFAVNTAESNQRKSPPPGWVSFDSSNSTIGSPSPTSATQTPSNWVSFESHSSPQSALIPPNSFNTHNRSSSAPIFHNHQSVPNSQSPPSANTSPGSFRGSNSDVNIQPSLLSPSNPSTRHFNSSLATHNRSVSHAGNLMSPTPVTSSPKPNLVNQRLAMFENFSSGSSSVTSSPISTSSTASLNAFATVPPKRRETVDTNPFISKEENPFGDENASSPVRESFPGSGSGVFMNQVTSSASLVGSMQKMNLHQQVPPPLAEKPALPPRKPRAASTATSRPDIASLTQTQHSLSPTQSSEFPPPLPSRPSLPTLTRPRSEAFITTNSSSVNRRTGDFSGIGLPRTPQSTSSVNSIPDFLNSNQTPPVLGTADVILTKGPSIRAFTAFNNIIVTGHRDCTKIWYAVNGSMLSQLNHPDLKVTCLAFRPSHFYQEEGKVLWIGFSNGEIWSVDVFGLYKNAPSIRVASYSCTQGSNGSKRDTPTVGLPVVLERKKVSTTGHAIVAILRYRMQLWTIDENDVLQIWSNPLYDLLFSPPSSSRPNSSASVLSSSSQPLRAPFTHTLPFVSLDLKPKLYRVSANYAPTPSTTSASHPSSDDDTLLTCIVNGFLWVVHTTRPKQIDIFNPIDESLSFVAGSIDVGSAAGGVTSITWNHGKEYKPTANNGKGVVFTGHDDGKIIIWDAASLSKLQVIAASNYKITALYHPSLPYPPPPLTLSTASLNASDYLWVGLGTGKIFVFDITANPWTVVKDWKSHGFEKGRVGGFVPFSVLRSKDEFGGTENESNNNVGSVLGGRWRVASLGIGEGGGVVSLWDEGFMKDWIGTTLKNLSDQFCTFSPIDVLVCSWNLDASKPQELELLPAREEDDSKLLSYDEGRMSRSNSKENIGGTKFLNSWVNMSGGKVPHMIVVGFQETVNLESKKTQAKAIFKKQKHKENPTATIDVKQYKLWQDAVSRAIAEQYSSKKHYYKLVVQRYLVGLFLLVFVRDDCAPRVRDTEIQEVKTGFGGLHGNKGAIVTRLIFDDSSLCFIVAHLAAGQSQTLDRNKHAIAIFESASFEAKPHYETIFNHGSDGHTILNHESVFFFGDLNYRIALPRDQVERLISRNNWAELQRADQLLLEKETNRTFTLRLFNEQPLNFCPTYKYDPGTDLFDTSEKKRIPAWCDRILYRGGNIRGVSYLRHESKISDHRPISGEFEVKVKKEVTMERVKTKKKVADVWDLIERERLKIAMIGWCLQCGYSEREVKELYDWAATQSNGYVELEWLMEELWKDRCKLVGVVS
ncbi:hypothetical protein BKA69DRAFT_1125186 [Paraphysoderma sedebokerense]|nr:hypothetical protein BKA69DRAFT_1125186 [Paraphysoderma sedebokerense]